MKYRHPLKQILAQTRSHWDQDGVRPEIRHAFYRTLLCQTPELGANVYASADQERIVFHTCKSPTCSSCGHRATMQWQRARWSALPDVPYKGITFTMPKELWTFFDKNRTFTNALPAIASNIIEAWAASQHGLRVGVIAIVHTFNGCLEFNPHVHTMLSAGGLKGASRSWLPKVFYDSDRLMGFWRSAIITLLREAYREGLVESQLTPDQMAALLRAQNERRWMIKIQSFESAEHFLLYAGRYVRRPPIAQHRITYIGKRVVMFWAKDKKRGERVQVECSPEEFIDRWAQHVRGRYQHAVRSFGLFAPRALSQTSAAIFGILGQKQRPRPRPRRWADSIRRDFGYDPLLDRKGHRMRWVGRLEPQAIAIVLNEDKRVSHKQISCRPSATLGGN